MRMMFKAAVFGTVIAATLLSSSSAFAAGWSITVDLPSNRDYKGTLKVYSPSGSLVYSCEALGRGMEGPANGYDHTAWWKPNADTPTGKWTGTLIPASPAYLSYGLYERISLTSIPGQRGHADIATNLFGRHDFMIHGGVPETNTAATWYPLRPTYGSIRVSNSAQASIANWVKTFGGTGTVTINGSQFSPF
jgi:hypothetical protein